MKISKRITTNIDTNGKYCGRNCKWKSNKDADDWCRYFDSMMYYVKIDNIYYTNRCFNCIKIFGN